MIVFGLGNPGSKYKDTRHNVGFMTVERMADLSGLKLRKACLLSYRKAMRDDLVLVEPLTYMNRSGIIFPSLVKDQDKIVVVVDNLDLPVGRLKIKRGGSSAGHNGLKSIIGAIGEDFIRVYIGISRPQDETDIASYVLSPFSEEERKNLDKAIDEAVIAIKSIYESEDMNRVIQRANSFNA